MGPPEIKATITLSPPLFTSSLPLQSSKLSCSTVYFKSSRASWWEASFLTQECLVTVEVGFPWTTFHFKDTFKLKCSPQGKKGSFIKARLHDGVLVTFVSFDSSSWEIQFSLYRLNVAGISKVKCNFNTTHAHTHIFSCTVRCCTSFGGYYTTFCHAYKSSDVNPSSLINAVSALWQWD